MFFLINLLNVDLQYHSQISKQSNEIGKMLQKEPFLFEQQKLSFHKTELEQVKSNRNLFAIESAATFSEGGIKENGMKANDEARD